MDNRTKWFPVCWQHFAKHLFHGKWCLLTHISYLGSTLQWHHSECVGVSNHQPHDCYPNVYSRRRSMKTSKLRITGLCVENSPVTGEFPAQRASNVKNVSIWWRHDELTVIRHWFRYWLGVKQVGSHYLSLCWPASLMLISITWPQCVKVSSVSNNC